MTPNLRFMALAFGCLTAFPPLIAAQTSTQLYSTVEVRSSLTSAGYGPPIDNLTPNIFTTLTVDLTCPSQTLSAVLSGPLSPGQPGGNLLVDNNILVTVTQLGGTPNPRVNVCSGGVASGAAYGIYNQNCYNSSYQDASSGSGLQGVDPDTLAATDGVPPIDIGPLLIPGVQQTVKIDLVDEGHDLATSSVFLNTNCTEKGVTGPTHVNGNPIPQNNPQAPQLVQSFNFDRNAGTTVVFTYNLSRAANDPNGTLTIPAGSTPWVNNQAVTQAVFNSQFRPYTSFSTSQCLIHFGEVDAQGNPACKLFTMECVLGSNPAAAGANCPVSSIPNERMSDAFDGPRFSLQDIQTPNDGTFHEGFGFLMANDTWTGGTCTFDPAASLNEACPQNLMVSFTGPGITIGSGNTTHPNSTFIMVEGVPEARTSVRVGSGDSEVEDGIVWVNSTTVPVKFHAVPPYLYDLSGILTGADTYIAQPIKGITYGISAAGSVPDPATEPIASDTTLLNGTCPIPTPANPGDPSVRQPAFDPPSVTITFPGEGLYALHHATQDCAGTQDLKFTKVNGSWTTNFRVLTIGVDTTAPAISIATAANGTYAVGSVATVSFSCTDTQPGSGLASCGGIGAGGTFATGALTRTLNTSTTGAHSITLSAVDRAGNRSSQVFTYTVQ